MGSMTHPQLVNPPPLSKLEPAAFKWFMFVACLQGLGGLWSGKYLGNGLLCVCLPAFTFYTQCVTLGFVTHSASLWVLLPRRELIQNPGGVRGKDASRHVKEASVRIRQAGHGLSFKDTPSWT